jgi:hypothetical protein
MMNYPDKFTDDEESEGLSIQEKSLIVSLATSTLVYVGFGIAVWSRFRAGTYDTDGVLIFWSRAILILIGLYILFYIIGQILLSIVNTVITAEEEYAGFDDERDKRFELLSTRNSSAVFGVGFLVAMVALAIGRPAETMFVIMFLAMMIGAIVGDVTKLVLYRRGQ